MIEADSHLEDGSRCLLEISELSTSFHNQYELLTHGSSGLLVTARVAKDEDDGSMASSVDSAYVSGEAIVRLHTLKNLAAREDLEGSLPTFMSLLPFEENQICSPRSNQLYPAKRKTSSRSSFLEICSSSSSVDG